jgi:Polyphosphate kinase
MQAAEDPNVLAIKTTMYRIAKKSPIIDALKHAREKGKSVAVIVELKAKFDEETNINWAKDLEEDGVHVVYGLEDLKVHAKICLIVRKRGDDIVRYSYISTGNLTWIRWGSMQIYLILLPIQRLVKRLQKFSTFLLDIHKRMTTNIS